MGKIGVMMELATLLHQAETASVDKRIERRDAIAAYGSRAIDGVQPWLASPSLAAFAIRVIERVGSNGEPVLASKVLRSARSKAPSAVSADIDWALKQIKVQSHPSAPARPHGPTPRVAPRRSVSSIPRGRAR
jgi:hypothetical protein